jgi:Tfp pilus assembly protein PilF
VQSRLTPVLANQTKAEFPEDLPARLIRGELTLAQVFGLDDDSLYEIARVGYGLFNSGNLREAKQIYAGLVAADPYDSVFHCHLAAIHHSLGELEEAFTHYTEALKLNLANTDALVGLSEIQLSRGDQAAGVSNLKKAIALDRDGAKPSTQRARALLRINLSKTFPFD